MDARLKYPVLLVHGMAGRSILQDIVCLSQFSVFSFKFAVSDAKFFFAH